MIAQLAVVVAGADGVGKGPYAGTVYEDDVAYIVRVQRQV